MVNMPWFRLYSEILDDKKIKRICRTTGHPKALVIGVWVCFLALANESGERGRLTISENIAYKIDDLADETGLEEADLTQIIDQFEKLEMIITGEEDQAIEIKNWNGRQFKSDNSTERVKRFRMKQSETFQQQSTNVIDTESYTDTDTDTESNTISATVDFFDEILVTWETKTGIPILPGADFAIMVKTFEKVGVTAKIYGQALDEMLQQDSYPLKRPTSAQEWAINIRKKMDELEARKSTADERKLKKTMSVEDHNQKILEDIANGR